MTSCAPRKKSLRHPSRVPTLTAHALLLLVSVSCADQAQLEGSLALSAQAASGALAPFEDCTLRETRDDDPGARFYDWHPSDIVGPDGDAVEGSILKCDELAYDQRFPSYTTYRVMYRTTALVTEGGITHELAIPATGIVYVPKAENPQKPRPVLANTHGLTGLRASCAPSFTLGFDQTAVAALLQTVPDAIVVVPDYAGLGVDHSGRVPDVNVTVPKLDNIFQRVRPFSNVTHPFVSLEGEGRATVDLVRAARTLPNAHTGEGPQWFAVGQSQGGHAALATAEVVTRGYGSEMQLLGVVAGAPATELENRDLRASSFLTDKAMAAFERTSNAECATPASWLNVIASYQLAGTPWRKDPFADPAARAVLNANSPGRIATEIPVFVGQIIGDPFIREARTREFVQKASVVNPGRVTYCEYAPIEDPSAPLLLRLNNHDALRRMFDGTPCRSPSGVPQFLDAAQTRPTTPTRWVQDVYAAANP